MATLTLQSATADFILSEGEGSISRDAILLNNGNLAAGTVLGQVTKGEATAALVAGATGNGTFGAVTVGTGSKPGVYQLVAIAATKFIITDPDGIVVGVVTLGTAFSAGGLGFTFTAGATPHVVGDRATITIAAGSGEYLAHDPAATTGEENAVAILYSATNAVAATTSTVAITKMAEVNSSELTWHTGISAGEKTAAIASLATKSIIVR